MGAISRVAALGLIASGAFVGLIGAAPQNPIPSARYPAASATTIGPVRLTSETDPGAYIGGVQIFVAAGLDREPATQSGASALVADCILRTPVALDPTAVKVPLRDAIAALGASITYTVDGRSVHYYIEARGETLASAVALFSQAVLQPDFSLATLDAARASLTARSQEAEGSALTVAIEMFRRSYYAGSTGLPALGSASTIASLNTADLRAFYAATYRRSAISASAVGNVVPEVGANVARLAGALPDMPIAAVSSRAKPIPATAPKIIAHRDVGAPWIVVGFAAPDPSSADFGGMLVLESLLSTAFERDSSTTLGFAEKSVGAFYLYDSTPASLVFYVNGAQVEPSLALRELLLVSKTLSVKPLGAAALERYKTAAIGHFLTDSTSISDRSYLLGTFASQGLGTDAMNAALAALQRTTSADVERVSKRYLQRYIVALVLPRQAASQ
jgi:predicted Zn-dependent peptidase